MKSPPTLSQFSSSAVHRFTLIIRGLLWLVADAAGPRYLEDKTAGLFVALAWVRLDRFAKRFDRLITRLRNGTLSTPQRPPPSGSRHEPGAFLTYFPDSALGWLPKRFGWLVDLVPETSWFADKLREALADPEIAEQLAAAPQLAKLLRPIGHMLGVHSDLIGSRPRGAPPSPSPQQEANAVPNHSAAGIPPATPPPQPRPHKARPAVLPDPALLKNA